MVVCLVMWLILVCVLALVWYLSQWVLSKIVDIPPVAYQIFGIILGLVALVQLLGCLNLAPRIIDWPTKLP